MGREKKDGTYLNVRINSDVYKRLAMYCDTVGQTKTIAVERALNSYINEYEEREKKLKSIEKLEKNNGNE